MDQLTLSLFITAVDRASRPLNAVGQALQGLGRAASALDGFGTRASLAGQTLDATGARMRGAIQSVMAPAEELETAMASLATSVGPLDAAMSAALEETRGRALAWQQQHAQSAAQYVAVTRLMSRAGFEEADSISATETALRVATATHSDSTAVARTLGVVYQQMGDHTADASTEVSRLGDMLTRAAQASDLNIDGLADPLKDAIPTAQRFGVSLEQTLAIIGRMNAAGIEGGESGAGFSEMLNVMETAAGTLGFQVARTEEGGVDLVGTLRAIHEQYGPLAEANEKVGGLLSETFGPGAYRSLVLLDNQLDQVDTTLEQITNSTDAAAQAQATMEATTSAKMAIVGQQWDALKIQIAEAVMPAVQQLLPHVTAVITAFADFATANPEIVQLAAGLFVATAAAASTLAPVLMLVGSMSSAAATAMTMAGKIGDLATGLASFSVRAATAAASVIRQVMTMTSMILPHLARVAVSIGRMTAQAVLFAARGAAQFVIGAGRMALSLVTTLFPQTSAAVVAIARTTASAVTFAARGAAAFVGGVVRMAASLAGQLAAALAGAAASMGALVLRATAFAVTTSAQFVGAAVRMAASLATSLVTALASAAAAVGRLVVQMLLLALRTADRFIASAISMGASLMMSLLPALASATAAAGAFALALLANPITWVVAAIVAAVALIYLYWDPISEFFVGMWTTIKDAFTSAWNSMTGFISGLDLGARVSEIASSAMDALVSVLDPFGFGRDAFGALTTFLENFSLADAGANIIRTLTQGITNMASMPVDAMLAVVTRIRRLLPFSPAKEGPLMDLHRVRLVETVAESLDPEPLVSATRRVMTATRAAFELPGVQMPTMAPMPASWSREPASAGAASSSDAPVEIHFHLADGGSDVSAQLEAWIRNPANARRLTAAAERLRRRDAAAEFA